MHITYRSSQLWRKAMDFAINVNHLLRCFPDHERLHEGLAAQLLQAVIRVPSRIAESYEPFFRTPSELLHQAAFHLTETELLLEFSERLGYLDETAWERVKEQIAEIRASLNKHTAPGELPSSDTQSLPETRISGAA